MPYDGVRPPKSPFATRQHRGWARRGMGQRVHESHRDRYLGRVYGDIHKARSLELHTSLTTDEIYVAPGYHLRVVGLAGDEYKEDWLGPELRPSWLWTEPSTKKGFGIEAAFRAYLKTMPWEPVCIRMTPRGDAGKCAVEAVGKLHEALSARLYERTRYARRLGLLDTCHVASHYKPAQSPSEAEYHAVTSGEWVGCHFHLTAVLPGIEKGAPEELRSARFEAIKEYFGKNYDVWVGNDDVEWLRECADKGWSTDPLDYVPRQLRYAESHPADRFIGELESAGVSLEPAGELFRQLQNVACGRSCGAFRKWLSQLRRSGREVVYGPDGVTTVARKKPRLSPLRRYKEVLKSDVPFQILRVIGYDFCGIMEPTLLLRVRDGASAHRDDIASAIENFGRLSSAAVSFMDTVESGGNGNDGEPPFTYPEDIDHGSHTRPAIEPKHGASAPEKALWEPEIIYPPYFFGGLNGAGTRHMAGLERYLVGRFYDVYRARQTSHEWARAEAMRVAHNLVRLWCDDGAAPSEACNQAWVDRWVRSVSHGLDDETLAALAALRGPLPGDVALEEGVVPAWAEESADDDETIDADNDLPF